jgi:hypothetical protein
VSGLVWSQKRKPNQSVRQAVPDSSLTGRAELPFSLSSETLQIKRSNDQQKQKGSQEEDNNMGWIEQENNL